MRIQMLAILGVALFLMACGGGSNPEPMPAITVNSLEDSASPPEGEVTLRSALAAALSGQAIEFDASLDGATIELSLIEEDHTLLKGEVMGMRDEPSGPVSYLVGYFDRDYGKSALYARKHVVMDASDLPLGITVAWTGGDANPARVLAVYGDLTLNNVSITGGRSVTEALDDPEQPWTLGRGAGVAVWGTASLRNCEIYDNHAEGDFESSRDRGAFGGGVYANIVAIDRCVISGNTVVGGGAAGGGVFSVGGAGVPSNLSLIENTSICSNRIRALFAYGGGVYSDGGGIGNRKTMELVNTTVARNLVEPAPGLPPFMLAMGYWRGGGVYMSNGYLSLGSSTIVENEVYGVPRTDSLGRPNLAGGVAATIGNAHAVEQMVIGHSIIAGNWVHEIGGDSYGHDIFSGSLLHFRSRGYNRIGIIDFSQILVPVGQVRWETLIRKHYPKQNDQDGVDIADVLDLNDGVVVSDHILSAGVDAPHQAVSYYQPRGSALDQVPVGIYTVNEIYGEYSLLPGGNDNFLSIVLDRIESGYGLADFASNFSAAFENFLNTVDADEDTPGVQPYTDPNGIPILTLEDTLWFGPAVTWPKELYNYPYIEFWHQLDAALLDTASPQLGQALIGEDAWTALFDAGVLIENSAITMRFMPSSFTTGMDREDQLRQPRPANAACDIGAIEIP